VPASILAVGSQLGSYRLEEVLGRGGMGVVYRAVDLRLGRNVALKLLPAEVSDDARFRSRFLEESRLAASIDHAGIIPIYEAGEVDGHLYIAMRYVEGTDLATLLRREGRLSPERTVALVAQLGDALDAAHGHGLLHRDVKPGNVLIAVESSAEHVYLADFGITKRIAAVSGMTATTVTADGPLVGTIAYLAPEHIRGEHADGRADLYALGCILFECLTGEPPFRRDDEVATIYAHLEEEPPRPSDRAPELPGAIDAVVARALAKEPDERYASGAELAAAAHAALLDGGTDHRGPPGGRPRVLPRQRLPALGQRTLAAVGVLIVALLAATTAVLVRRSGHSELALADTDAVAVIDPGGPSLKGEIRTGFSPSHVVSGYGAVWVTNTDAQTVSRLDPRTRTVSQKIPVGAGPSGLAVGAGAVWVVNGLDGTLSWISPQADRVVTEVPIGNGPTGVCVADGAVWVADAFARRLVRFDPVTRRTKAVALDASPTDVACGGGSIWVSSAAAGGVTQVDARSATVVRTIATGAGASGLAFGDGLLWVANTRDGTVSRIDPRRGAPTGLAVIGAGDGPTSVAAGGGRVWVGNARSGTLVRIDRRRAVAASRLTVGNRPQGVALVDGMLWVGVQGTGAQHRGGTLRIVAPKGEWLVGGVKDIDPAIQYETTGTQILALTNDTLLAFQRVGGRQGTLLVPDLATALPVISDGGRTIAFRVRGDVRYATGEPVRPSDVARGLERVVRRGWLSQSALYHAIRGAPACSAHHAHCDLSAGVRADDRAGTITFHLSAPDPEFLDKLALPFATAVPPGTGFRAITRPLPATGPYQVVELSHRSMRLVRNPRFRPTSDRPDGYPDAITKVEAPAAQALRDVEQGRADYVAGTTLGNASTTTRDEILARYPTQVHDSLQAATIFLNLNTRVPPFDDVDARRAVNFAVDRRAAVAATGGNRFAQVSCSLLPANFPAYSAECPYTAHPGPGRPWSAPDLARARRLVARSGTRGMHVTVWGWPDAASTTRYVGRLLRRLGYHARVRLLSVSHYFTDLRDSRHRTQILLSYWAADYPAASNFLEPQFTCRSFRPNDGNQLNSSEFCDPRTDELVRQAQQEQAAGGTGDAAWGRVERRILDRAAAVPLIVLRTGDFVSRRVGHFQYNPQSGVLYDQMWVR
jgi:YVTN family beta-propeller protein